MIHEYAIDPAVLSDLKAFRYIAAGLGMHVGRVVCPFPKDWKRLCYQVADKHGQQVKHAVTQWLQDRGPRVLTRHRSNTTYDYNLATWCENAVQEHGRAPFKAILAYHTANSRPPIIDGSDLDPQDPLWNVPTQVYVQRCAAEFATHVGPLLRHARQIRIVDPYFVGDSDQVQILNACISYAEQAPDRVAYVEIHVDGNTVKHATVSHIESQIGRRYPKSLPPPKIVRWMQGYLHNRLILTDMGGVTTGDTLRQHDCRGDHIILLEEPVWRKWWHYHDRQTHADNLAS